MDLGSIVSWLTAHWADIGSIALAVLGAASVIARLTPTEADNKVVDLLLSLVHGLGLTKPSDPPPPAPPEE